MSESCFAIVLDVMAREIDMLRYQLKAAREENEKLRNHARMVDNENAKLRVMIEEGRENHE